MIKDTARKALGLISFHLSAREGEDLPRILSPVDIEASSRALQDDSYQGNAPSASPRRSTGDLTSEKMSERLDGVRVSLGALVQGPVASLVSSQNLALVNSVKIELSAIKQGIDKLISVALWSGPGKASPLKDAPGEGQGTSKKEREGYTVFHERERTVVHSDRAVTPFERDMPFEGTSAPRLKLADGSFLTSEMAEQLLLQLSALHAEQSGKPGSLVLLSELTEARVLCQSLKKKIEKLEIEQEERSRQVQEAAASLERQLEGQIESLRGVMKGIDAVRSGRRS